MQTLSKNWRFIVVITGLIFSFGMAPAAQAQMDPRLKALGSMAMYGTAGGAMLGLASKAFDTSDSFGRAIAKGASLGLYAGLLFGTYVITSHALKNSNWKKSKGENYYPEESNADSPFGGGGSAPAPQGGTEEDQRWQPEFSDVPPGLNDESIRSRYFGHKKYSPIYYLDLLQLKF